MSKVMNYMIAFFKEESWVVKVHFDILLYLNKETEFFFFFFWFQGTKVQD